MALNKIIGGIVIIFAILLGLVHFGFIQEQIYGINVVFIAIVIFIAHRLNSITDFERIIVMDKGRVAEEGTHTQLLENDGKYRFLWGVQHKSAPEAPEGEVGLASWHPNTGNGINAVTYFSIY